MKKSVLLLAGFTLASVSAFAQTKPTVTYANFAEAVSAETPSVYYLYNVETSLFITGGNYWGTRACVINNGSNGSTNNATIKDLYVNKANVNGYKWEITQSGNITELEDPCYQIANKTTSNYLTADNWNGIWVDGGTNRPYNYWYVKDLGNNTFQLYYDTDATKGPLGVPETAEGVTGNTNTYFVDPSATYTKNVDGEDVTYPAFEGAANTTWALVTEEEYERVKPLIAVYYKTKGLVVELEDAKAAYPEVDFSAAEAITKLDNPTDEQLTAASQSIKDAIADYEASKATFDEPKSIDIGDGSDIAPWTREFTGTGEIGTWHTNTWSTEANNGADGTDMTTPFCEDWVAKGGILSDQKIYKTVKLNPGLYKFTINARAYNEAGGIDSFEGLSMYFGDQSINLQDEVAMYTSGGKSVLWKKGGFSIIAIVSETSEVEFGFNIENANWNWLAFKGTSLTYYGNQDVEANKKKLEMAEFASFDKITEADANPELINAYNDLVDQIEAEMAKGADTDVEAVKAMVAKAEAAKAAVESNEKAYQELLAKIKDWDKTITESNFTGDEWGDFSDFIQTEEIELEGYPSITPTAIVNGDRSLTTEEINEYIGTVEKKLAEAIAHSLKPGDDCSKMIVNAKFTDPENKGGWIDANNNCTLYGGIHKFPVAESYHSTFDIYQEIEGVQDGVYSLSLNGFCRLDKAGEDVAAKIYMNDFATKLANLNSPEQVVLEENAQDGFNCYLTATADGPWTTNPIFWVDEEGTPCGHSSPNNATDTKVTLDGGATGLVPNGMEGASVAFSAGRYEAKVYGLVKGGKMRIGIRNTSSVNQWALWSNFTLTYEGNSAEALLKALPIFTEKLDQLTKENRGTNMSTAIVDQSDKAVQMANDAMKSADEAELTEALLAANAAINAADDNIAAIKALNGDGGEDTGATGKVDDAYMSYGDYITPETEAMWSEWMTKAASYQNLTTEEITELTNSASDIVDALKYDAKKTISTANTETALDGLELDNATAEAPVEITGAIVNNSFEEDLEGWDCVKGGDTKAADNSDATYKINWNEEQAEVVGGYVFNTWSGSIPEGGLPASQMIFGLPAGTYTLSAYLASDANNKIVLSANDVKEEFTMKGDKATPNAGAITFYYDPAEREDLTIGVVGTNCWYKADYFQLFYLGNDPTAIKDAATAQSAAPVAIYTVSGAKVSGLQKGINIVKMANGKTQKVLVK